MDNWKRFLPAAAIAIGILVAAAPSAWGQGHCMAFDATEIGAYYLPGANTAVPNGGWVSDITFLIGSLQLHAKAVYDAADDTSKIPPEAGRNVAIGTETGKLTFDDGSKLEMPGHFTAVRLWAPNGVARLNESGTIEKGTGTFTNASGNFTTHGVFGPGVLPADSAAVMGVVQDTSGTICLNLADIVVGGKK